LTKSRLEAFSDGVLAVIITIMVLELKVPHGAGLEALLSLSHILSSYVLSFIFIGIYWNNHHHMMHAVERVNGGVLWANLHLLFWLSLVPFTTGWLNESGYAPIPVATYGIVLLMSGVAYFILSRALLTLHSKHSSLAKALERDVKGIASLVIYIIGIGFSVFLPMVAMALYALVAAIWLVPDRRFEQVSGAAGHGG